MTNQGHKVTQVYDLTALAVRSRKLLPQLQVRFSGVQAAVLLGALVKRPLPYLSPRLGAPHSMAPGTIYKANDMGQMPAFPGILLVLCCHPLPFLRTLCSHSDHLSNRLYSPCFKVIRIRFPSTSLFSLCHTTLRYLCEIMTLCTLSTNYHKSTKVK